MMRFVCLLLVPRCVEALLATAAAATRPPDAQHVSTVYGRLLEASRLLDPDGRVTLTHLDISTALSDMHLEGTSFVRPDVVAGEAVDVTELVTATLPTVLAAHPAFLYMAEQTVGNDDFFESVYFGTEPRGADALDFGALSRRLVASVYIFELLLAQDRDAHRSLAQHYETRYAEAVELRDAAPRRTPPRSLRDALMRFFLAVKGESVLASINSFESMRRAAAVDDDAEVSRLSGVLNSIMRLNLLEAILSNLSFAYWPDNARAGMALLLTPLPPFGADLAQQLDSDWFELYLAWNVRPSPVQAPRKQAPSNRIGP